MNFSEQPPSTHWAALKYGADKIAEVWFKPEGEQFAVAFRIPKEAFAIPGMPELMTVENLVKAVGIVPADVESWRTGDAGHADLGGSLPELAAPLSAPPDDVGYLDIHVNLKPPAQEHPPSVSAQLPKSCEPGGASTPPESGAAQSVLKTWEDLEARWGAILGMEAVINNLRQTMEGLQSELQAALQKQLTIEEKLHARNMDLMHWNKEKGRAHFALPKLRDYIHRATWQLSLPERKTLGERFKEEGQPSLPPSEWRRLGDQLESLLKDRQVLSALGAKVYQESKSIAADIQAALRTLHSNAAANAERKRRAAAPKGKFFKDVRRLSGAE